MPDLVRATAWAVVTLAVSDVSSATACHHFSIWHFPWPQRCPTETEANPPTPSPTPPPKPTQDEELQRQRAIEKLKGQLNSPKLKDDPNYFSRMR
jgi:hypothetical protein